ncbi:MAG: tetratricopeptide repeat protein, partial [Magnetococcales bacterium]|nr:tetratricopeptide repeat protein [Magnetococcales bacterium]
MAAKKTSPRSRSASKGRSAPPASPPPETAAAPAAAPPAAPSPPTLAEAFAAFVGGETERAGEMAEAALRLAPDNADAWHLKALVAKKRHQFDAAEQAFEQAIQRVEEQPQAHILWTNRGNSRGEAGDLPGAEAAYRQALKLVPGEPTAAVALGQLLFRLGRLEEAEKRFKETVKHHPTHAAAVNGLGTVYQKLGDLPHALKLYQRATELDPTNAAAWYNLGGLLSGTDPRAAMDHLEKALAANPGYLDAATALLRLYQSACDWPGVERLTRRVMDLSREQPDKPVFPFAYLALPTTLEEQQEMARRWVRSQYGHLPSQRPADWRFPPPQPTPERWRIGYLSSDLRQHATAQLLVEALELHDRSRFEILAYSVGEDDGTPLRRRVEKAFDRFVDGTRMTVNELAAQIHADGVHILVDLNGYTRETRSAVLALRPAPIQVNFLGFPGTLGAGYVDYILVDPVTVPLEDARWFDEKLAILPDAYQPNDRQRPLGDKPSRAACGLPEQGVVFACFNHPYKITAEFFAAWCRLLRETPDSVLWLLSSGAMAEANLRREAQQRGVDPARLIFAPHAPLDEYLTRLQQADLFLDTCPYNAHTTASDALWAGVPLVTTPGRTFASRVAASLLTAAGVPELIAPDLEGYVALARALADDPARRLAIRRRLEEGRSRSPLFDTPRFVRHLETLYQGMWSRYAAGHPPTHLRLDTAPASVPPPAPVVASAPANTLTLPPPIPGRRDELLIGCGLSRVKKLFLAGFQEWDQLVTLDLNPDHQPDVVWDLTRLPLPFPDDRFDEIHAYEVLEHTGGQGDYAFFFAQFSEFWRILKPGGVLIGTCPSRHSVWAWGDPSHTRIVQRENLLFLRQPKYTEEVGKTALSDFRYIYQADFDHLLLQEDDNTLSFVLKAIKPSRITPPEPTPPTQTAPP